MSSGVRIPIADALTVSEALRAALAPACVRIEEAGSIRRMEPEVGDIELVAVSRTHREPSGLFVEVDAVVWDLERRVDELVADGVLVRLLGKDRYAKLRHVASGLQVDLFTVKRPAQWGVVYAIRTGPAAYSQWLVSEARRRFLHVRGGALHRGSLGCGAIPCEIVSTPEERDFFAALGIEWVPPYRRSASLGAGEVTR